MIPARIALAALAFFAASAFAQQYKWKDSSGRWQYGDTPPPGVKAIALRPPPGPATQPSGAKARPSAAEQEAAFRKRQKAAHDEAEKSAKSESEAERKREGCARAKESLATLQSGQRIARTNAQGERYFLDDAQRASEVASAEKSVSEWCGG